jgi:integrase
MLVSEMAEALVQDYRINRRKSLQGLIGRIDRHLGPALGALAHNEIAEEIECYISERQEEGAPNATINRETSALRRMFRLAVNRRQIPASDVPYIPHLKETNVRTGFLRDQLYDALARETGKIGLWLRTLFELGVTYGMRKGELLGLRVRQINLEEQLITLNPGETKNGQGRNLRMSPKVFELVSEAIRGKAPEDYVFTREKNARGYRTRKGGHIVDMREAWGQATKAAGCPNLLFHDLRRTGVRNLIRSGTNEKVAMSISGHKTRAVFDRYNIIDQSDLDAAMDKLEVWKRKQRQMELFESGNLFTPPPAEAKPKKPN